MIYYVYIIKKVISSHFIFSLRRSTKIELSTLNKHWKIWLNVVLKNIRRLVILSVESLLNLKLLFKSSQNIALSCCRWYFMFRCLQFSNHVFFFFTFFCRKTKTISFSILFIVGVKNCVVLKSLLSFIRNWKLFWKFYWIYSKCIEIKIIRPTNQQ